MRIELPPHVSLMCVGASISIVSEACSACLPVTVVSLCTGPLPPPLTVIDRLPLTLSERQGRHRDDDGCDQLPPGERRSG
jgi:hypothetical protein